jgi:hypothetical protein
MMAVLVEVLAATTGGSDTSWPPALVYFAIGLLVVALAAVFTVFWRARKTIRPSGGRSK